MTDQEPSVGSLSKKKLDELTAMALEAPGINDVTIAENFVEDAQRVIGKNALQMNCKPHTPEMIQYIEKELFKAVKNLNGFTPSEMGILYEENEGNFVGFSSARSIMNQKMGLADPESEEEGLKISGAKVRMMDIKPIITQRFQAQYPQMGLTPSASVQDKLFGLYKEPLEKYPWLKPGMIDAFEDATGKLWVVKFKLANDEKKVMSLTEDTPLYNQAEVAQTLLALRELGFKPDHVILSAFSMEKWRHNPVELNVPDAMLDSVADVGRRYYEDNLLKQEMPKREGGKAFQNIEEMDREFMHIVGDFLTVKQLELASKKQGEDLKARIENLAPQYGVMIQNPEKENMKTRLPGIDIDYKYENKIDQKALIRDLEKDGVSEESYSKLVPDEALLTEIAQEKGYDLDSYRQEKEAYTLRMPQGKNHSAAELIGTIKESALEIIEEEKNTTRDLVDDSTMPQPEDPRKVEKHPFEVPEEKPTSPGQSHKKDQEMESIMGF